MFSQILNYSDTLFQKDLSFSALPSQSFTIGQRQTCKKTSSKKIVSVVSSQKNKRNPSATGSVLFTFFTFSNDMLKLLYIVLILVRWFTADQNSHDCNREDSGKSCWEMWSETRGKRMDKCGCFDDQWYHLSRDNWNLQETVWQHCKGISNTFSLEHVWNFSYE